MKTHYSKEELDNAILEARIEENIYWINRAHFMAAKKHQDRIYRLIEKYKPIDPINNSVYTGINKQG